MRPRYGTMGRGRRGTSQLWRSLKSGTCSRLDLLVLSSPPLTLRWRVIFLLQEHLVRRTAVDEQAIE
jgi:hypothetical protein